MLFQRILPSTILSAALSEQSYGGTLPCKGEAFSLPQLAGAQFTNIIAQEVLNYTAPSTTPGLLPVANFTASFCNITISYTHLEWGDNINVSVWLPLSDWNGKFHALGGGGYAVGLGSIYMTKAVATGFAAVQSDGGVGLGLEAALSPETWALASPGNVNLHNLENYASRGTFDMTFIGKAITKSYYGKPPSFSYFSGCSGGGRQALMVAQRLSKAFDGVLAASPAINPENFIPAGWWGQHVMHRLGAYPSACEIDSFTQAAIESCDALDGVKDGILSNPMLCTFDPHSVIGQNIDCNETPVFTETGAKIVAATWDGPHNEAGNVGWWGLPKDASLTTTYLKTECTPNGKCGPADAYLTESWIKFFLLKNPEAKLSNLTTEEFFTLLQESDRQYHSMVSASYQDLSKFRDAGGKMITWHGLADGAIPPQGSLAYYQEVLKRDPKADEYFRHFEAPGVGHCQPGVGASPLDVFEQLQAWVEKGTVPETLIATTQSGARRPLCAYPSVQKFIGGEGLNATFECVPESLPGPSETLADLHSFYYPS